MKPSLPPVWGCGVIMEYWDKDPSGSRRLRCSQVLSIPSSTVRIGGMEKNLVTICGYEILVIDEKLWNVKRC